MVEELVGAGLALGKANDVATRHDLLPARVAQRRRTAEHERPMLAAPVIVVRGGRFAWAELVQRGDPGLGVQAQRQGWAVGWERPQIEWRAGTGGRRRARDAARLGPRLERGGTQELDAGLAADLVGVQIDAGERLAPAARTDREHHDPARPIESVSAVGTRLKGDQGPGLQPALTAWIAQQRLAGDDVHPLLDPVVKVVRTLRIADLGLPHARADHAAAERRGQVVSRGLELASFPQRLRLALRDVEFREHAA